MTDILSANRRSELMRSVRQKGTDAELEVRRLLRRAGYGYLVNQKDLPGSPDIVIPDSKKVIFVHGCFWHAHQNCKKWKIPHSNKDYWEEKFFQNVVRDKRKAEDLRRGGYDVLVIWECDISQPDIVEHKLTNFLSAVPSSLQPRHPEFEFYVERVKFSVVRNTFSGDRKISSRQLSIPSEGSTIKIPSGRDVFDWALLRATTRPDFGDGKCQVRVADLFAGAGGLSLGAAEACRTLDLAFRPVLALDSDKASLDVYKSNFCPDRSECIDILKIIDGKLGTPASRTERDLVVSLGEIDLLLAGPPCQGHSDLNNHTRRKDKRNGLYDRIVRFAEIVRPRHILVENVPAIVHATSRVMQKARASLENLGYSTDDDFVNLSKLGVPQRRRRHLLMASLEKAARVGDVVERNLVEQVRTVSWAISDVEDVATESLFDTASKLSAENLSRVNWLTQNNKYDLPNNLRPTCHQNDDHSYRSMYGRLRYDASAQTITTGFGSPGQGRYIHPTQLRTITPHEAARLQMFPDYFDFSSAIRRGQLARMIGNAVPMTLTQTFCLELLAR